MGLTQLGCTLMLGRAPLGRAPLGRAPLGRTHRWAARTAGPRALHTNFLNLSHLISHLCSLCTVLAPSCTHNNPPQALCFVPAAVVITDLVNGWLVICLLLAPTTASAAAPPPPRRRNLYRRVTGHAPHLPLRRPTTYTTVERVSPSALRRASNRWSKEQIFALKSPPNCFQLLSNFPATSRRITGRHPYQSTPQFSASISPQSIRIFTGDLDWALTLAVAALINKFAAVRTPFDRGPPPSSSASHCESNGPQHAHCHQSWTQFGIFSSPVFRCLRVAGAPPSAVRSVADHHHCDRLFMENTYIRPDLSITLPAEIASTDPNSAEFPLCCTQPVRVNSPGLTSQNHNLQNSDPKQPAPTSN
ncbi:hypothetical protein Salat_1369700 [Sesamum alatum]|uniref:Uncharacterized protein n=1 Tax=Sesamum alatum TaxID=300844 RepID=A0AAE1Y9R6_9LAMI|nr:hypothetical protein Salat_1369700 [Sesamum alatum]